MTEHERHEPAGGAIPPQPDGQSQKPRDPSLQQVTDGARQVATGAKEFLVTRVAPAAQSAGRSVRRAVDEAAVTAETATSQPGWVRWLAPALGACAFFVLLAIFLPAVSFLGFSANLVSDEFDGEGWFLLVLLLVTIAAAVVATLRPARWSRLTAGIVGIIVALIGIIDGFMLMSQVGDIGGASVGPGLIFLTLWSVGMLLTAVGILWSLRGSVQSAVAQQPGAGHGQPWQGQVSPQQPAAGFDQQWQGQVTPQQPTAGFDQQWQGQVSPQQPSQDPNGTQTQPPPHGTQPPPPPPTQW